MSLAIEAATARWCLRLPPLPEAAAHEAARAAFRALSSVRRFAVLVQIGIYHPDGSLTEAYGGKKSIDAAL